MTDEDATPKPPPDEEASKSAEVVAVDPLADEEFRFASLVVDENEAYPDIVTLEGGVVEVEDVSREHDVNGQDLTEEDTLRLYHLDKLVGVVDPHVDDCFHVLFGHFKVLRRASVPRKLHKAG